MEEKNIKITQEELDSLKKISETYDNIIFRMGSINVQKILLDQQIEQLKTEYSNNQMIERDLIKTLNEKYGEGQLNLQTGEFITQLPQLS